MAVLLANAATNPAGRPDFYRQIFHFRLHTFVHARKEAGDDNERNLFVLEFNEDKKPYILAYSSKKLVDIAVTQDGRLPKNMLVRTLKIFLILLLK